MAEPAPRATRRTLRASPAVRAKALRLLATGRVRVLEADRAHARVEVQGDHGVYVVERHGKRSHCPCPHPGPGCSHARAAALVTGSTAP